MKKTKYLLFLVGLAGLCTLTAAPPQQAKLQYSWEKESKARVRINELLQAGLYDSAIACCIAARSTNGLGYDDIERALATAYWHKGEKERAYQYMLNQADYHLRLNGGGGHPFDMLYDFSFGDAIPTDTFLEHIVINKISGYYQSLHYFPERNAGLKLLRYEYRDQKLIHRNQYRQQQCADEACRSRAAQEFGEQRAALYHEITEWLKQQGKLYSESETGPAAIFQYSFIRQMQDPEDHVFFRPLVYEAMSRGKIKPDLYVAELVAAAELQGADSTRQALLRDSLCRIYKCTIRGSSGKKYIIYDQGDSVTYIDKDSFDTRPFRITVQDSTGKLRLILVDSVISVPSPSK